MPTVYFDFETGGTDPKHPSIQLAAIATENGHELDAFEQKIQFDPATADPEALRINHYSAEDWKHALTPLLAAKRFALWVRPYQSVTLKSKRTGQDYTVAQLAGYNALTFDWPRLVALFEGQFVPCSYQVRDVLQRVYFWYDEHPEAPRPENYKLTTVAAAFGLEVNGAHDALADCRLTHRLYTTILETL